MIQVHILQATKNSLLQKNGLFLEGELYFGRMSRNGNCYVVRSRQGYWIPVERYDWAKRGDRRDYFSTLTWTSFNNRKELNEIDSAREFFEEAFACQQCGVFRPYCNECI